MLVRSRLRWAVPVLAVALFGTACAGGGSATSGAEGVLTIRAIVRARSRAKR